LWTALGRSISRSFVSLIMFAAGEYRDVRQDRHFRVIGRAANGRPEYFDEISRGDAIAEQTKTGPYLYT
jgi:hypothetical protein